MHRWERSARTESCLSTKQGGADGGICTRRGGHGKQHPYECFTFGKM